MENIQLYCEFVLMELDEAIKAGVIVTISHDSLIPINREENNWLRSLFGQSPGAEREEEIGGECLDSKKYSL